MTLLAFTEQTPAWITEIYNVGKDWSLRFKTAADTPQTVHSLSGMLYVTPSNWALLSVPNALVRGTFDALDEPGAELPKDDETGRLNGHISVLRPEDIEAIGGPNQLTERGKRFRYTLGPVKTVSPAGWPEISKVWYIEVHSSELQELRRSYGLSPLPHSNDYQFHITVGVRKKNVLRTNTVSKSPDSKVDTKAVCEFCGKDDCEGCTGNTRLVDSGESL